MMVYMAGDNGKVFDTAQGKIQLMAEMASAGLRDLAEMAAVGTTDNVALTCLFDTPDTSYVIEVRKGRGFDDSRVRPIPPVNTGDPEVLCRFITESVQAYPADHYALVIWNHGTGWPDADHYAVVRSASRRLHQPVFRTTAARMAGGDRTRPIAYDDSAKDFLDSRDLGKALSDAQAATGARLNLIGMDACLMAMIEGARELAPFADFFVGSQEVEPMAGWPYEPIANLMHAKAGVPASELALYIVQAYAESYGGTTRGDTVTQSAIALAPTAVTEALCKTLVDSILANASPRLRTVVAAARDKTLVFQDPNFRDLGDFAARLAQATDVEGYPEVNAAAAALRDHVRQRGDGAPILRVGYLAEYERATGMSVYFPRVRSHYAPDTYRHLAFARATGWDRLLDWMFWE
jgi:hypothetical protein